MIKICRGFITHILPQTFFSAYKWNPSMSECLNVSILGKERGESRDKEESSGFGGARTLLRCPSTPQTPLAEAQPPSGVRSLPERQWPATTPSTSAAPHPSFPASSTTRAAHCISRSQAPRWHNLSIPLESGKPDSATVTGVTPLTHTVCFLQALST